MRTFLAEAHLFGGDREAARALGLRAREQTAATGHRYAFGEACRVLGRVAVASRALPEADAHLREALSVFTAIDARFEAARTRLDLADLERWRRDDTAAAAHRGEARRLFEALGLPAQVAAVDRLAAGAGATRAPDAGTPPAATAARRGRGTRARKR